MGESLEGRRAQTRTCSGASAPRRSVSAASAVAALPEIGPRRDPRHGRVPVLGEAGTGTPQRGARRSEQSWRPCLVELRFPLYGGSATGNAATRLGWSRIPSDGVAGALVIDTSAETLSTGPTTTNGPPRVPGNGPPRLASAWNCSTTSGVPCGESTSSRRCPVCGESLDGRRADARTCGSACRRLLYRGERLLAGRPDGPYETLAQWDARRRRGSARAESPSMRSERRAKRSHGRIRGGMLSASTNVPPRRANGRGRGTD